MIAADPRTWRAYPIVGRLDATVNGIESFMVRWLDPVTGRVLDGVIFSGLNRRQVRRARRLMNHYRISRIDLAAFPWCRLLFGCGRWPGGPRRRPSAAGLSRRLGAAQALFGPAAP